MKLHTFVHSLHPKMVSSAIVDFNSINRPISALSLFLEKTRPQLLAVRPPGHKKSF